MRLFLLMMLTVSGVIASEASLEDFRSDYRQFLVHLGFEDFSKEIDGNIHFAKRNQLDPGIGPASPGVLKSSVDSYQILNYSRELAVDVMTALEKSQNSPEMQKKVLDLTARMLSLQPLAGPREFPARVLTVPDSKLSDSQIQFIKDETERRMDSQALTIASDLAYVLVGKKELEILKNKARAGQLSENDKESVKKLNRINDYTRVIIQTMYGDTVLGQTRHAGRALAASIMKYAHSKDPSLEAKLNNAVAAEGLQLENFVGNTLFVPNQKGEFEKVQIQNGDFLMERSPGREAAAIGAGVRPNPRNALRAIKHQLVGYVVDLFFPIDKMDRSALTASERIRADIAQLPMFNHGISHVGIAEVKKDPATGISMAWANDVYPDLGEGKIRMRAGIMDQFALPGPYMRFGMARYSPELLWQHAQEQVKKYGYPSFAFHAEEEERGPDGQMRIKPGGRKIDYPITISEKEFRKLHEKPADFDSWSKEQKETFYQRYYDAFMERALGEVRRMMTEEGIGFAMEYAPGFGRLYCTQTVWMAAKRATGIDLQKYPDFWNPVAHLAKALHLEGSEMIRTDVRILHPAGFAWQPMADTVKIVTYPNIPYDKRHEMATADSAVPMDKETRRNLRVLDSILPDVGFHRAEVDRKYIQLVVEGLGAHPKAVGLSALFTRASVGTSPESIAYRGNCSVLLQRMHAQRPGVLGNNAEE